MRLIDADALMQTLGITDMDCEKCEWGDYNHCIRGSDFEDACSAIENAPTIEPERKKGRWIIKAINTFELAYGNTGYQPVYECSECGRVTESYLRLDEPIMPDDADFPDYCPNCGADMRGEQNGET